MKPSSPQLRFLKAVDTLATAGPVWLGDAMKSAAVGRGTAAACLRHGGPVRHDGSPSTWELTATGRKELVAVIDLSTGRPWGEDETGFDHQLPHDMNEYCPADSCSYCAGYHCGWYCEEGHRDRSAS